MRWLVCLLLACSSPKAPPSKDVRPTERKAVVGGAAIVDSHVHLAYYPVADALAQHGVRFAVDLAAPERTLGTEYPLAVIQSGPMLTRPGGYPLDSWGKDGYGIGCAKRECISSAIGRLVGRGAKVIKLALDDNGLDPALARFATQLAHQLGLKVVAHALSDDGARLAADIGVDALAHTPTELLSQLTVEAWGGGKRAVITTLAAFGGSEEALDNLRRLRAVGTIVLYGTDLGNLRIDGPSPDEIALMRRAGMTSEEITAAMSTVPRKFWGFDQ